jgi:hypothetical protein
VDVEVDSSGVGWWIVVGEGVVDAMVIVGDGALVLLV